MTQFSKTSDLVLIGTVEYQEAKRLRSLLEELKVHLELVSNPETCSTGSCKVTVEIYAARADLPIIAQVFESEHARLFDGLEQDNALIDEIYDPEKPTARCPACGTEFSTEAKACPDCGLVFI